MKRGHPELDAGGGAELLWLFRKISGEFLLIPRIPFRFLSSVPTSFSNAANSYESEGKKKSVLFFFKKNNFSCL